MNQRPPETVFVGVTGASGAPYALRLLQALSAAGCELTLSVSDAGVLVLDHELELAATSREQVTREFLARAALERPVAAVYAADDLQAPVASGSAFPDAAVICPCSMATVAHIALGTTRTLIHRVGEVALKEERALVLVPRETPLSEVHLQRLLEARRAGATIVPPMPAFYSLPRSVDDLVGFVVGKILTVLGLPQHEFAPWEGTQP